MSILVSLCLIKIEIDSEKNNNITMNQEEVDEESAGATSNEHPTNPRLMRELRGQRKPKKIVIESYANRLDNNDDESKGVLPKSSREQTPLDEVAPPLPEYNNNEINFFSGNPFVEVTKGILHLYKKNERTDIKEELSTTLCLIAVPATLNCHDILNFIAACHAVIKHVRILRDGSPNQFMVLLEFRTVDSALEFYKTFNGVPYNSLEPDSLCHAVWVSNIEWGGHDGQAPFGHTELPNCPVCLERMDESVDGVLTILCNHAFHAGCLIKWGDSTCPVCRCVQTPEMSENSVCMECEGTEALWICLICGHVGCGRYQGGHAASHYRSTNHTYALQLGTNRVWDYAGDNFVHRLLQSKTDGKLVATQSPGCEAGDGEEKIDSMQLEFTYLLTSQLDAQREYYEEKLARIESSIAGEKKHLLDETDSIVKKKNTLETKLQALTKEKNALDKKVNQLTTKLNTIAKELSEEKQFGKTLQLNQVSWQAKFNSLESKYKEKENEITELKEQVRDLMFYMEAQNTIANSELKDEIAAGSLVVQQSDDAKPSTSKHKRRSNKKK
uniref:Putative brca1-associated protein n=1 Tax=Corethrella appendiculata TaxID=1370023 RepID=U5ESP9_9DIPT